MRRRGYRQPNKSGIRKPNRTVVDGDVARLFIQRQGGDVLVVLMDASDLSTVAGHPTAWYAQSSGWSWYAITDSPMESGKRGPKILMHRLLMDFPSGMDVDHINGNGLDNRRANLRVVDHSTNQLNRSGARSDSVLGIRGVYFDARYGTWIARGTARKIKTHIGSFKSKEEAIAAREAWEMAHGAITRK